MGVEPSRYRETSLTTSCSSNSPPLDIPISVCLTSNLSPLRAALPLPPPRAMLRYKVYEPILVLGPEKLANLDIRLRVKGGGHVSQLYALRQAIAKGVVA
jgi:hypothetical protein